MNTPNPAKQPKEAESATKSANAAMARQLSFSDTRDFDDARRGFIGTVPEGLIATARGSAVWRLRDYQFLEAEEAPDTVNPSLWRQARLNLNNGLFLVTERVYQVRGLDIANMTIIEGDSGLIIIDPVSVVESARACLELYFEHRPKRPIAAVIYSHSHTDHYGGVKGVINAEEAQTGWVKVIAPDGFMEAVSGENVLVGRPMYRRAQFQIGSLLRPGPRGQVDAGLGKTVPRGIVSLIAPNQLIVDDTERHVIDGVEIDFQLAPESEAPAEMHMYLPQFKVLNMAENATHTLHNFCPIRGAVVRDPRMWSKYLGEAIELYGDDSEILIGQHHWPTWGQARIVDFLAKQRDLYKFIHDQTVRMMNHGLKPAEIAEKLDLPPELQKEWAARGFYGTVNHNSKAVYQRYLSWYDGNPANLHPLPPVETARQTVAYMGGTDAVIARAKVDFENGNFRWVAQVMSQVVFAEPDNEAACHLAADAFEQLGYQAESATWRNAYLYGAQELRDGVIQLRPRPLLSPDLMEAIDTSTLFDYLAVRLIPEDVVGQSMEINWRITDQDENLVLSLRHGCLSHIMAKQTGDAVATVRLPHKVLADLVLGETDLENDEINVDGDRNAVATLFAKLDRFPFMFNVVTPHSGPSSA